MNAEMKAHKKAERVGDHQAQAQAQGAGMLKKTPLAAMFSGIAIAFAITCIVFIAYALLLTYTEMTEKNITLVVIATTVISVIVAGFDTAKGAQSNGLVWGMVSGLVYGFILIAVGTSITHHVVFSMRTAMLLLIAVASGGVGGVFGINAKKKR